jgi:HEAT repeat protein
VQLAKTEPQKAFRDLVQFLRSTDWQIRVAAADGLARLGTTAGTTKNARARPDENVRIAAVGVLLEEDDWLKHELGMTGMEPKLPASAS